MKLIDSDYHEVPGPHKGNVLRELFRVFDGRFCFPLGVGIRCGGGTTFTITEGETRSLELAFSASVPVPGSPGLSIRKGIEYTHTFTQEIGPWEVGECGSMYPVLCFDNAEVRIYRQRRPIRRYELSAFTEQFDPRGNRGWATKNGRENDADCECHDQTMPSTVDGTTTPAEEAFPRIAVVRPIAFLPAEPSDGYRDDPQAAAQETAEAIASLLGSDEEDSHSESIAGITRSDGSVIWLTGSLASGLPNLALLPFGLSSLPRQIATFDQGLVAVVAVGPATEATRCEIAIRVRSPGGDELRDFTREQAALHASEGITAVWYEADFAELPGDSSGIVELELFGADDRPIGYPIRESFVIDPLSLARIRERV